MAASWLSSVSLLLFFKNKQIQNNKQFCIHDICALFWNYFVELIFYDQQPPSFK